MSAELKYGSYRLIGIEGGMRLESPQGSTIDFNFDDDDAFICILKLLQRFNTMREDLNIKSPIRLVDLHWIQPGKNQ